MHTVTTVIGLFLQGARAQCVNVNDADLFAPVKSSPNSHSQPLEVNKEKHITRKTKHRDGIQCCDAEVETLTMTQGACAHNEERCTNDAQRKGRVTGSKPVATNMFEQASKTEKEQEEPA